MLLQIQQLKLAYIFIYYDIISCLVLLVVVNGLCSEHAQLFDDEIIFEERENAYLNLIYRVTELQ